MNDFKYGMAMWGIGIFTGYLAAKNAMTRHLRSRILI